MGYEDEENNVFFVTKKQRKIIVKQPRPENRDEVDRASRACSERTRLRYVSRGMRRVPQAQIRPHKRKKPNKKRVKAPICDLLLFQKGQRGILNLIMELDGEVVGFDRIIFKNAHEDPAFKKVWGIDGGLVAENYIAVVDKWQRRGIGSQVAPLSTFIAREFGADWMVGLTWVKGGMVGIRLREGWNVVNLFPDAPGGAQVAVRKRF